MANVKRSMGAVSAMLFLTQLFSQLSQCVNIVASFEIERNIMFKFVIEAQVCEYIWCICVSVHAAYLKLAII